MLETKLLDEIIQQLNLLSVEQLFEVREKIDALIELKSPSQNNKFFVSATDGVYFSVSPAPIYAREKQKGQTLLITGASKFDLATKTEDTSVKNAIELVESWMADESGYDEQTYPQIEEALNQE